MSLQTYGLDFSKFPSITQLEIELMMVADRDPSRITNLSRGQHIKHCIKMLWPQVMESWNDWNELALWAWTNHSEIGVTGCASAGKTFTFTLLCLLEYLAKPMGTRVSLTSTTVPTLRGRVWAEMMRFTRPVAPLFGLNIVDSQTKIQFQKGDDRSSIIAVAVESGSIEHAVGRLQGVHLPRMVIMVDEAAQTNPAIFSARANLQTGTNFYRFVAIANASSMFDAHGLFCEPAMGWGSIQDDDEFWETKTGICIRFDGLKSPNVKAGRLMYPYLFSLDNIESIRKTSGEGSLEWNSYVRGMWSKSGVRNTLVDSAMIQEGNARDKVVWAGGGVKTIAALDPAFTTEGDDCILRLGQYGKATDDDVMLNLTECMKLNLQESDTYPIFYQIADQTIEVLKKHKVEPENFAIDTTGAGAGVADIISQRWNNGFKRVSFGGAATDSAISMEDDRPAKSVYANRVTQLWGQIKSIIMAGRLRGLDDITARELCARIYTLKSERMLIESKKDLKKRTKGASPDRADALALLCEIFMENNGMGNALANEGTDEDFENFFMDNMIESDYR
jgi:hypothetical protein